MGTVCWTRCRAPRTPISRIGDLRTDALHQDLRKASICDSAMIDLLVLALARRSVTVQSAAETPTETSWRRPDVRRHSIADAMSAARRQSVVPPILLGDKVW